MSITLPLSEKLLAVDCNQHTDEQMDNVQRMRYFGTLSCKWYVFIKPHPLSLRDLCRRGMIVSQSW